MGFTVVHSGETHNGAYRDYLQLLTRVLLQRGANLADVPRVRLPVNGDHWLYLWESEADARAFLEQLRVDTEDPAWAVLPVSAAPSSGPLRPIEVHVSDRVDGWTFALAPWARKALQDRFVGAGNVLTVSVRAELYADWSEAVAHLSKLAPQVLPILAGLGLEELRPFGSYVVLDPVEDRVLTGPVAIQGN
jgi:hypothetical protein